MVSAVLILLFSMWRTQHPPARNWWQTARTYFVFAWDQAVELILHYAYLISLAVLYLCGLQEVNVINAVFLMYFVGFLIFPRLARIGWVSLVIYTELVIALKFLWQMSFADGKSQRFWGLEGGDSLWLELRFHLVILFFTAIQMDAYEHLAWRERQAHYGWQREIVHEGMKSVVLCAFSLSIVKRRFRFRKNERWQGICKHNGVHNYA